MGNGLKSPHILFVLVDQMRADALGQATPALNALARRGVRFENCYCAATLCSPSRNSIVTGLFPGQHGVCGNMGDPIAADLRADTHARHLQAGSAGCRGLEAELIDRMLARMIRLTHYSHLKERINFQQVRV
ncbi:MAG: sulfatase-like hydrolase/transferase [Spirochaetaceae bacterium]|nr:sulfatase-like hydrolase/transferase [Spirochaetaceae bacterium]